MAGTANIPTHATGLDPEGPFQLKALFWYDEPIAFDHESWRGRIRASRGVGASLNPETLERFDQDHAAMLATLAAPRFTLPHRLSAHVYRLRDGGDDQEASQ